MGVANNLSWGSLVRPEGPKFKAEIGEGILGRMQQASPHQLGSGEAL